MLVDLISNDGNKMLFSNGNYVQQVIPVEILNLTKFIQKRINRNMMLKVWIS